MEKITPAQLFTEELQWHSATVYASKSPQPSVGHGPYDILETFASWDDAKLRYLALYQAKEREGYKYLALELAPHGALGRRVHKFADQKGTTIKSSFGRQTIAHWTVHSEGVRPTDVYGVSDGEKPVCDFEP